MLQVTCDKSMMATSLRLNISCSFLLSLYFFFFHSVHYTQKHCLNSSQRVWPLKFSMCVQLRYIVVYVIFYILYNVPFDLGKHLFGNKFDRFVSKSKRSSVCVCVRVHHFLGDQHKFRKPVWKSTITRSVILIQVVMHQIFRWSGSNDWNHFCVFPLAVHFRIYVNYYNWICGISYQNSNQLF